MAYTYSKIATYTVGSGGVANINFLNIPQTYTDLKIVCSLRGDNASTVAKINFNNDTSTSNYLQRRIYGDGVSVASDSSTTLGYINPITIDRSTSTANTFSNVEFYIPNYTNSNNKSVSADSVLESNTSSAGEVYATLTAGLWSQTSAITSINLTHISGNFAQYSSAHLYGIKAEL